MASSAVASSKHLNRKEDRKIIRRQHDQSAFINQPERGELIVCLAKRLPPRSEVCPVGTSAMGGKV